MIASRTLQRANTIPEMALVLSLVMLTLFGVIQYALVGFNQIGSDGAAFVGDHTTVALYGGPTVANGAYAQQVGQTNFPHSTGQFTSSIPKTGTYEVDIASTQKAFSGMAQLFPTTTSQTSRIIEPSQSQAASAAPPVGQCATAALNATFNGTPILTSTAVGLLGNISADKIYQTVQVSGGTALQFNIGALDAEDLVLSTVSTNLTAVANDLATVKAALDRIKLIPFVGTLVANQLQSTIQTSISPIINSAVGGTYVAGGGSGTTAGINLTVPLSTSALNAQVTATTNAVQVIESSNAANSLLSSIFTTTLNPALYGTPAIGPVPATPGLLGDLTALNTAQTALNKLDNSVSKCV